MWIRDQIVSGYIKKIYTYMFVIFIYVNDIYIFLRKVTKKILILTDVLRNNIKNTSFPF